MGDQSEGCKPNQGTTRLALLNAASIAGLFLTTEVAVASTPVKNGGASVEPPMY